MRFLLLVCCVCFSTTTLSATSRGDLNSMIRINYGVIEGVESVKLQSSAPGAAVMGGIIGATTSGKHKRGKHAAEGALAGALISALVQGKNRANQYLIALNSGGSIKVTTEQGGIRRGDCVSVEQGSMTNVRRVSDAYCNHPEHEAFDHPVVQAKNHHDAATCHQAKEFALKAQTESELDIALKKVQIFCDT